MNFENLLPELSYQSEQEAAKGILGEAVKTMSLCSVDYVVIGGWIPYLFYTKYYSHPGSFDVDILLNEQSTTEEDMVKVVNIFREHGFLFSAKNKFQIHKVLNVNGEPILFHVDFLHRKYAPDQDEGMFINWNSGMSIAGPGTDIIFAQNERIAETMEFTLPDGKVENITVDFASEIGFLGAKGRALTASKRIRDSYDIFLIITQSRNYTELVEKSKIYYHGSDTGYYKKSLDSIYDFFQIPYSTTEKGGLPNGVDNALRYINEYKGAVNFIPEDQNELKAFIKKRVCGFIELVKFNGMGYLDKL